MLLGIVANPPEGLLSEKKMLERIEALLDQLHEEVVKGRGIPHNLAVQAERIEEAIWRLVQTMKKQVRDGYHVNGRGTKTSDCVQAIIYRHREDGEYYVHGFGDADLDLKVHGDELRIRGLEDDTEVQMFAQPDGSVRIVGRNGQHLWEDFPK